MLLVKQSVEILRVGSIEDIEWAARTCYASDPKGDAPTFVRGLRKRHHRAMEEFTDLTVRVVTSRAIANELTRHRLCSFAQESTRYVNYMKGEHLRIVWDEEEAPPYDMVQAWQHAEIAYRTLVQLGHKPERARDVLPLATATKLCVKANWSQWRYMMQVRERGVTGKPHPDMVRLMGLVHKAVDAVEPMLFEGI